MFYAAQIFNGRVSFLVSVRASHLADGRVFDALSALPKSERLTFGSGDAAKIQRLVTEFERQDHALGVRRIDLLLKLDNRKVAFCPYLFQIRLKKVSLQNLLKFMMHH
jgi:hypothetical protein